MITSFPQLYTVKGNQTGPAAVDPVMSRGNQTKWTQRNSSLFTVCFLLVATWWLLPADSGTAPHPEAAPTSTTHNIYYYPQTNCCVNDIITWTTCQHVAVVTSWGWWRKQEQLIRLMGYHWTAESLIVVNSRACLQGVTSLCFNTAVLFSCIKKLR